MKLLQQGAFFAFFIYCSALFAANPPRVQQFINHKDWSFVENKGQLATLKEKSPLGDLGVKGAKDAYDFHPEIKYYGHQGGVYLYCKPGMISFVFTKIENQNQDQISEATGLPVEMPALKNRSPLSALRTSISTSRADIILENANPNAEIIASDKQEYYENFYLAYIS